MNPKTENLIELIFSKLKKYQAKEISLDKEDLKKFISSLFKESWFQRKQTKSCYSYLSLVNLSLYNFSLLTIVLIIVFILSLYFLIKVTSNAKN